MLVVSKQRVMRHKLSTDVNWSFSDILIHTIIYKAQQLVLFTHMTSTLTMLSVMESSLLVVALGDIYTCSFLRRNAQSGFFFFPQRFVVQDANRPAGCHHCSVELWDDVSASRLRSVFSGFRNVCFQCSILLSMVIILTCPIATGQTSQKQDFKV